MRGYTFSLLAVPAIWMAACSHDAPSAARPAKPIPAIPSYTTASIAPVGATKAGPLAPGRIASIYGSEIGPATPCKGAPDPHRRETPNPKRPHQTQTELQVYPPVLCETEVLVGGVPAGLMYVSSGQINFKVPQSVDTEGSTTVQVRFQGRSGPLVPVPLSADVSRASSEPRR